MFSKDKIDDMNYGEPYEARPLNGEKRYERELYMGNVDGYHNGKASCPVTLEMSVEMFEDGKIEFSASGNVWNHIGTDIIHGGQCIDSVAKEFRNMRNNEHYANIQSLWQKYHLNGMYAGTEEQENALDEHFGKKWERENNVSYDEKCAYLESIGLNPVTLPNGEEYYYGHSWLHRDIPFDDMIHILDYIENGMEAKVDKSDISIADKEHLIDKYLSGMCKHTYENEIKEWRDGIDDKELADEEEEMEL